MCSQDRLQMVLSYLLLTLLLLTNGRVFCGDPSPAAFSQGQVPPSVQCKTTNGVAACGYDCKTSNGRVACASVPWGRCIARDGNVLCGPSY
jgi:hypothetical protein